MGRGANKGIDLSLEVERFGLPDIFEPSTSPLDRFLEESKILEEEPTNENIGRIIKKWRKLLLKENAAYEPLLTAALCPHFGSLGLDYSERFFSFGGSATIASAKDILPANTRWWVANLADMINSEYLFRDSSIRLKNELTGKFFRLRADQTADHVAASQVMISLANTAGTDEVRFERFFGKSLLGEFVRESGAKWHQDKFQTCLSEAADKVTHLFPSPGKRRMATQAYVAGIIWDEAANAFLDSKKADGTDELAIALKVWNDFSRAGTT